MVPKHSTITEIVAILLFTLNDWYMGVKLHPGKVHQITAAELKAMETFYEKDLPSGGKILLAKLKKLS